MQHRPLAPLGPRLDTAMSVVVVAGAVVTRRWAPALVQLVWVQRGDTRGPTAG